MSTLGNYHFINHFKFLSINATYYLLGMFTSNNFIIQWIYKNCWNTRLQRVFFEIYLKRSKCFFHFIIIEQLAKRILEKLQCNLSEKSWNRHLFQRYIFRNRFKAAEWTISHYAFHTIVQRTQLNIRFLSDSLYLRFFFL
jgi:hypothetical protein